MRRFTVALLTPNFLTLAEVLAFHDHQVQRFGGSPGVRDMGLLESALAQPAASFGGELLHPTIANQAAAYLYHIAKIIRSLMATHVQPTRRWMRFFGLMVIACP